MKIFKYSFKDISIGVHINDIQYLAFLDIIETFTETVAKIKIHTDDESDSFYFISDMDDQIKMIDIFNKLSTMDYSEIGEFELTYEDVTDDVLKNIDNYDTIENFDSRNRLLEHYYSVCTPDSVLEKILDSGLSSLSKHDKFILDESVKYK